MSRRASELFQSTYTNYVVSEEKRLNASVMQRFHTGRLEPAVLLYGYGLHYVAWRAGHSGTATRDRFVATHGDISPELEEAVYQFTSKRKG